MENEREEKIRKGKRNERDEKGGRGSEKERDILVSALVDPLTKVPQGCPTPTHVILLTHHFFSFIIVIIIVCCID